MNLTKKENSELLEMYEKIDDFIKFLDKEKKDASSEAEK
jgi:hypothetical protein